MEKTRVKIGHRYWWIRMFHGMNVCVDTDYRCGFSSEHFKCGNYFHSEEEAETMAKKIHLVLDGDAAIKKAIELL